MPKAPKPTTALIVTPPMLARRVVLVQKALDRQDESTARAELRLLAADARRLASASPFPLMAGDSATIRHRQTIRAEMDARGAT